MRARARQRISVRYDKRPERTETTNLTAYISEAQSYWRPDPSFSLVPVIRISEPRRRRALLDAELPDFGQTWACPLFLAYKN